MAADHDDEGLHHIFSLFCARTWRFSIAPEVYR